MATEYLLVLEYDIEGTTASIITQKGDIVSQGCHFINLIEPRNNWSEFNALESIYGVRAAINNLFQNTPVSANDISAIGITTSNQGALVWDKDSGLPLYNGISTSCKRTHEDPQKLTHSPLETYIKEKTGSSIDYSHHGFYWKWLVENVDSVRKGINNGTAQVGTLDTWLIYNLTGRKEHMTDYTHAFKTLMLDLQNLTWDSFLMSEFLLTEKSLPVVTQSSHIFGRTEGFLSLPDNIPILAVAFTPAVELLGSNGLRFQESKLTLNYSGHFTMNTGTQVHNISHDSTEPVILSFPKEVRYGLEGKIPFPTGIHSFVTEQQLPENSLPSLFSATPDSGNIYLIPEKKSHNQYTTSLFGLDSHSTQAELLTGYYKSIVFCSRHYLDEFQNSIGLYPKELKVNGLLAKHDFLLEFMANILQIPIIRMKENYSKYVGLSYLIGIVKGFYKNDTELLKLVKIDKQFLPTMDPITSISMYNQWLEHKKKSVQTELVI